MAAARHCAIMHVQRHLGIVRRSVAVCSLIALCAACSESTSDDGSGAGGGAGGSAGTGAENGGTTSSGGAPNSGGTTSSGGATTGGAGGTSSGAGGISSGAGGVSSGAGGMLGGTGGMSSGAGGSAGDGGSATGGLSGSAGSSGAGGAGGKAGGGGSATGGLSGSAGSSGAGGAGGAPTGTRSPGCGTAVNRPNPRTQQTMTVGGTTRYYLLDVPANADNQTPLTLVFGLHGYDMNNVAVVGLYNFTSRSNNQAITVLPQGEGPPPGDVSHWGDNVLKSTWSANETNYTFIRNLMTDLENRFCINPSRVFITGFSMGGFFTNSIACAHNDWFRGFAPVAGGGPGSCANANAKPAIMLHHGTADDIVDISSGEESRDFWLEQNGCMQTSTSSFTGCQTYNGCPSATPVIWCVGNWNHTISSTAAANIWTFFNGLQ